VSQLGLGGFGRKAARSLLFYAPSIYRLVHSQARSEVQHRLRRPHEDEFRALALLRSGDRPLVIDVGANVGQSIFSIRSVMPRARIVSFEPNPAHMVLLNRLQRRFGDLTVWCVALGSVRREVNLYIPVYRGKVMSALASLDEENARSWLSPDTVFWFAPDRLRIESVVVQVRTLDSYQLDPDFIKIDAQGAENDVIAGALETIRRSRPVIMAESMQIVGATKTVIETMGYRLLAFDKGQFTRASGQVNTFLVPSEVHPGDATSGGVR
jgi:FkbM family methyltransferase